MQVVKKIQQELFDDVLLGKKKAEFRLNDFDMQEGDIFKLVEVDKNNKETGRNVEKKVTYSPRKSNSRFSVCKPLNL